jgi:beta-galactosidase
MQFNRFKLLKGLPPLMAGIGLASASLCAAEPGQPLDQGWEFYRGSLGSTWEIWRGEQATDNVAWSPVTLPHCFNARDAADPDERYYQGPGWYRTHLAVANPFPGGRTLLHFDGAGQKSQVFVGLKKVGEHTGGYDQWDVDL